LLRQSNTKKPHDPHELFLDEGISGPALAALLRKAKLSVHEFQKLLPKNKKIPDSRVIQEAAKARYVIVSRDLSMESDWTEEIIQNKAKVIMLTDQEGGPMNWASAIVCGELAWERVLLNHPNEPVIIKINRSGAVQNIAGEKELIERRDHLLTIKITQAKKSGRKANVSRKQASKTKTTPGH
jgi:predicted nuclease of predicted toxin-antitoxin system